MKKNLVFLIYAALIVCLGGLSSCSPKNVAYFQDVDDITLTASAPKQITAQPDDKLSIIVSSKTPELSAMFNLPIVTTSINTGGDSSRDNSNSVVTRSGSNSNSISYYTVSPEGTIDFPVLGTLKIEGMTRSQISAFIKGEIVGRGYLKDPVVTVEFMNTGLSVLGEVNSPGRYLMNRDRVSILDALALAGDLTIQGRRDNVLVVREEGGKRSTYRLDLTSGSKLLASPAYYLQQGDVVYVEPNDVRKRQTTNNGNVVLSASFWVSVASLLTSVAVLIFK